MSREGMVALTVSTETMSMGLRQLGKLVWAVGLILSVTLVNAAGETGAAKEKVETVLVELGPDGFYPKEIHRKTSGKFYIYMRLNLGRQPVTLQLENTAGETLKQVRPENSGRR